MTQNRMGLVGGFQLLDLFGSQLDVQSSHGIIDVMRFAGADDGCGDAGSLQDPGQGDLRRFLAGFLGEIFHSLNDRFILIAVINFFGQ